MCGMRLILSIYYPYFDILFDILVTFCYHACKIEARDMLIERVCSVTDMENVWRVGQSVASSECFCLARR